MAGHALVVIMCRLGRASRPRTGGVKFDGDVGMTLTPKKPVSLSVSSLLFLRTTFFVSRRLNLEVEPCSPWPACQGYACSVRTPRLRCLCTFCFSLGILPVFDSRLSLPWKNERAVDHARNAEVGRIQDSVRTKFPLLGPYVQSSNKREDLFTLTPSVSRYIGHYGGGRREKENVVPKPGDLPDMLAGLERSSPGSRSRFPGDK